ncbi:phasin family protein [Butyricicoccus sp. Marseille-Q5471]|uniref:phasin family protein n=1 Tax=Butyricicoccus sp. Marseille-Q5471 TaxID=3039493 RepID=UPI0024BCA5AA|nr:phasin family protein [Butyricicoccus sp. Marseille-Q5471]
MIEKFSDDLKKIFLAGVGAVAVTAEKSGEMIDKLVEKGQLTVEQGKVLNEELKHNAKKTVKNVFDLDDSAESIAKRMDSMSQEELAVLRAKLAALDRSEEV